MNGEKYFPHLIHTEVLPDHKVAPKPNFMNTLPWAVLLPTAHADLSLRFTVSHSRVFLFCGQQCYRQSFPLCEYMSAQNLQQYLCSPHWASQNHY